MEMSSAVRCWPKEIWSLLSRVADAFSRSFSLLALDLNLQIKAAILYFVFTFFIEFAGTQWREKLY